jgi:hypothetical protein
MADDSVTSSTGSTSIILALLFGALATLCVIGIVVFLCLETKKRGKKHKNMKKKAEA